MAIAIPGRSKEGALDKLVKGLTIANQGINTVAGAYGLYKGIKQEGRESEAYDKAKEIEAQEKDAASPLSKAAREAYTKATGSPLADTVSAFQMKRDFGPVASYSMEAFKSGQGEKAKIAEIQEKGRQDRLTDAAKAGGLSGEDAKLAKLSGMDRQRYDNVIMANDAIRDMASALGKGESRYSVWGDNNYTNALSRFEEALGRMQSGGAINKDEGARFRQLARSFGDDPSMQAQKLQQLQQMMQDRYKSLGFDPGKNNRFAYAVNAPRSNDPTVLLQEARAGQSKYSPDDIQALQWAEANKGDPRAQKIVEGLRSRGL